MRILRPLAAPALSMAAHGWLGRARSDVMGLVSEFKEFALKGNMIDLAVGVIIGAAFGGLVKSLVDDMMMPPLGWLMGGLDFKDKAIILAHKGATHPLTGKVMPADVIFSYG